MGRVYLAIILLISTILYSLHSWEWSFIDDSNLKRLSLEFQARSGPVLGLWESLKYFAINDKAWGLFRPAYWVYETFVYLMPPEGVYALRFLMFLGILWIHVSLIPRKYFVWPLILVLSNSSLYWGLSFPSLQEFSGCFFASLGFHVLVKRKSLLGSNILYLIAALFKGPFIWLVFGNGIFSFAKGNRKQSILALTAALLCFITMFFWVQNGSYTSGYSFLNFNAAITTLRESIKPLTMLVVFSGLFLAFFRINLKRPWNDTVWISLTWFVAGLLYYAQLLPWSASGYYLMGPYHLISLGWFHGCIQLAIPRTFSRPLVPALVFLGLFSLGTFTTSRGFWKVFCRNATITQIRDWALTLPTEGLNLAINFEEPAARLFQLMELRTKNAWTNPIAMAPTIDEVKPGTKYYIFLTEAGHTPPEKGSVIKKLTWGVILELQ